MAKKKYINKGTCIWCGMREPEVTFFNKPHTISKQIGAEIIGNDICDSCNLYFGIRDKNLKYSMSVELAFKEIMNLMRILLNGPDENTHKQFKSVYFNYYHSKSTIKFKNKFSLKTGFLYSLTRQFKKGIYEVFLQEYHRVTENALDKRFDKIRDYVRFDRGDIPLWFLVNNGVYLIGEDLNKPSFSFNDNVKSEIDKYGFYTMMIYGQIFYLEVTPRCELTRNTYLINESQKMIGSGFIYSGLKKLEIITDFDFTLRKLYG